ncbi:uncharacterized protein CTRU02_212628 [Colletotrichum truncatum]|uniref:Uncharacterized protein n=1 Tax=Colletotrichum truncatum TaxID=5467 RepID=A0ACC3YIF9_COLTU|nr:uncharacterized protein CTRU02_05299 [Colletotrichum truncatum]KAF6794467.1 hypothetical protein CTRU02_05299 [Colletotrichum truncatum]
MFEVKPQIDLSGPCRKEQGKKKKKKETLTYNSGEIPSLGLGRRDT